MPVALRGGRTIVGEVRTAAGHVVPGTSAKRARAAGQCSSTCVREDLLQASQGARGHNSRSTGVG